MPTIITKALLLVPVFCFGYLSGALVGHIYHGLRYGRVKRRRMQRSTLEPYAVAGCQR